MDNSKVLCIIHEAVYHNSIDLKEKERLDEFLSSYIQGSREKWQGNDEVIEKLLKEGVATFFRIKNYKKDMKEILDVGV